MFGKSVFRPDTVTAVIGLVVLACLVSTSALAQSTKSRAPAQNRAASIPIGPWQRGEVISPNPSVYEAPNFDSKVIGRLKGGTRWPISKRVYGAFFQVKLPGNRVGYVTDADIVSAKDAAIGKSAMEQLKAKNKGGGSPAPAPRENKDGAYLDVQRAKGAKPIDRVDYQGVNLGLLRYQENTMGISPADQLFMLGFKASGQDVMIQGLNTEMNIQFSLGPPRYYEQATGRSADGFLFLFDTQLQNAARHGPDTMSTFGIGPVFRFSKFGVTLPVNGKDEFYSLEDMAIGAKFAYGINQRFGSIAARLEAQYYWEKNRYYGLSLSLQYGNSSR